MDSKLRCVFELPMDAAAQAPQNNVDASPAPQPQMEVSKPSPKVRHIDLWLSIFIKIELDYFFHSIAQNLCINPSFIVLVHLFKVLVVLYKTFSQLDDFLC